MKGTEDNINIYMGRPQKIKREMTLMPMAWPSGGEMKENKEWEKEGHTKQ